jgi:hypothetical protein
MRGLVCLALLIAAAPYVIEITGVTADQVSVAIMPH